MNIQTLAQRLLVAISLSVNLSFAHAEVTLYSDAASFNASVTSSGMETFFGVRLDAPSSSPMRRRTQVGSYYTYLAESSTSSFLGAGSLEDVYLTPNVATDVVTFSHFSSGITAFGGNFFGTDFSGQYLAGDITLEVTDSTGLTTSKTIVNSGIRSFLGFATDGAEIVSVRLFSTSLESGDSLWPTADNLILAQAMPAVSAIPEPATNVLLMSGISSLLLFRLVRRRSS